MCCIFTCCGWMIDLIQRFWTFTMSCCISSAVCCALITASMSGIAMGYNYSLAEYIDLKETNVSVYLKRGVFDDEIGDDVDWRRSGHMPVEGHLRDSNLMTAGPDNEEMPQRAARRMDDSLVMSDDQHKFEGSLMRLTVKPPAHKTSAQPASVDDQLADVLAQFPSGSMDQIKAIHTLMNQRRANNERNTKRTPGTDLNILPDIGGRRMEGIAPGGVPMYHGPFSTESVQINGARLAVPDRNVGRPDNWFIPKGAIPESYRRTMNFEDDYPLSPDQGVTRPQPIIFTMEMKRPTRPKPENRPTHTNYVPAQAYRTREEFKMKGIPDDEMQIYKAEMLKNKDNIKQLQHLRLREEGGKAFKTEDDYADQANRGVPVRKKRGLIELIMDNLYLQPTEKAEDKKDEISDTNTTDTTYANMKSGKLIDIIETSTMLIETSAFTLHKPI